MLKDKPVLRRIAVCALTLVVLWVTFVALMTLTALIPTSAIESNMHTASEFYHTADMFENEEDNAPSLIHHYADAVLLNIIWNLDSDAPLSSAMDSAYYQSEFLTQGRGLHYSVNMGGEANTSYARYWHGMAAIVKPLLTIMGVNGIKIVFAVALAVGIGLYFVLAIRRKLYALAISSAVGLVICRVWVVPMCIEYVSCFLLMLVFSCIVLAKGDRLKNEMALFVVAGACTCFFDFLTCEVLTLGVPLVCWMLVKGEDIKKTFFTVFRCCAAWLTAYALTFAAKWCLASVVLGRSMVDIALTNGADRLAGTISETTGVFQPTVAIATNLYMIFPFSLISSSQGIWALFLVFCLALFCVWYLFRKEKGEVGNAPLMFIVALIPLVRYFVVNNHAALHPFMTYRSLLITVIATTLGMVGCVTFKKQAKKSKSPGRNGK